MTLEEIRKRAVNDIIPPVLLRVGIGKHKTIPAYICGFTAYTTPAGEIKESCILSNNKTKDTITGNTPIIYTSYNQLLRDFQSVKKMGSKVTQIEELYGGLV